MALSSALLVKSELEELALVDPALQQRFNGLLSQNEPSGGALVFALFNCAAIVLVLDDLPRIMVGEAQFLCEKEGRTFYHVEDQPPDAGKPGARITELSFGTCAGDWMCKWDCDVIVFEAARRRGGGEERSTDAATMVRNRCRWLSAVFSRFDAATEGMPLVCVEHEHDAADPICALVNAGGGGKKGYTVVEAARREFRTELVNLARSASSYDPAPALKDVFNVLRWMSPRDDGDEGTAWTVENQIAAEDEETEREDNNAKQPDAAQAVAAKLGGCDKDSDDGDGSVKESPLPKAVPGLKKRARDDSDDSEDDDDRPAKKQATGVWEPRK